ncbi:MAG: anthranilate synthase component I [Candidatus Bathyarchaeota archaeon]|nr:anthranilate synthase component I [Candidatus Bathyarchaeota archaeon]
MQKPTITQTTNKLSSPLSFKKIPLQNSPLEVFSKLNKHYQSAFLLESIEGPKKLAQFSFLGFDPQLTIQIKNGVAITRNPHTSEETKETITDPLQAIKRALGTRASSNKDYRFASGAVGYISYDAVRNWEKIPSTNVDDLGFPDVEMGVFDDGIVFDHKQKRVYYYYYSKNRLPEIEQIIKQPLEKEELVYSQPKVNVTKTQYEKAVEKAKEYITQGDIFQVVLSKRFDFRFKGDLTQFYSALRAINPSPYMYFYKSGNRQIVGSSPEMLARLENRTIETFPIAGTRPVAANAAENRRLARELLADPKERAEHVMLVDLARNDVGKISKFGSVRVPEFMQVHRYSHVQHIVSRVVGDLKENCDCFDALRSVFPAGTVSGAPKVRAMEIIEELEPTRRGPYAGAVGYFSYNGNMDFAITIRTLFADGDKACIQAGAGIVADSVPEREWFETEQKAGALMKALQACGDASL